MKKINKKLINKKANNKKLVLLVYVLSILILICTWQLITNYQHKQEIKEAYQAQITRNINKSGSELDKIASELNNSEIAGKTERSKYCYHASRKWEEGPIYCTQKLDTTATNVGDDQMLSDFVVIYNVLHKYTFFSFINSNDINAFDKDLRIYQSFGKNPTANSTGCRVNFNGRSSNFQREERKSQYEVSVDCLDGDFNKPIYPLKD